MRRNLISRAVKGKWRPLRRESSHRSCFKFRPRNASCGQAWGESSGRSDRRWQDDFGQPCLYIHMHTLSDIFVLQMFTYSFQNFRFILSKYICIFKKTMSSALHSNFILARSFFLVCDEPVWVCFLSFLWVTNLIWHVLTKGIPSVQKTRWIQKFRPWHSLMQNTWYFSTR